MGKTEWETLTPQAPFYLFVPQNIDLKKEYEQGWKITEVMTINTIGIVTGNDKNTVAYTKTEAISLATANGINETNIRPLLFHPFDNRLIVYDKRIVTRPRNKVMHHMISGDNLCLAFPRSTTASRPFEHIFCAASGPIGRMFPDFSCITYFAPLYSFPTHQTKSDYAYEWKPGKDGRTPNLSKAFVMNLAEGLGLTFLPDGASNLTTTFGPEDVFHYAYAVFHCPTYRSRYATFLKENFPRLPLTRDVDLFRSLCAKGKALVDFHLLRDIGLRDLITTYSAGSGTVEKGYPRYDKGRVYINKTQYFEGIAEDVWEFQIGGYQVLDKWLKDRRGRTLSGDDGLHYQKIVVALTHTIRLMDEIDDLIPEWPLA